MINPARVSLVCRNGHSHFYDLDVPGEIDCKVSSCSSVINASRVTRGIHPYIIMTGDKFQDESGYIQTFTVIPLTSKTTFSGLPDVYPITRTARNALTCKSYALVHQICTVDANCFKNHVGNWKPRVGQLDKRDKEGINKRLKYFLGFDSNPEDDWFKQNATLELAQKIYGYLSETEKNRLLGNLLDTL